MSRERNLSLNDTESYMDNKFLYLNELGCVDYNANELNYITSHYIISYYIVNYVLGHHLGHNILIHQRSADVDTLLQFTGDIYNLQVSV